MCTVWRMLPGRQHSPHSAHIFLPNSPTSQPVRQHSPHSAHIFLPNSPTSQPVRQLSPHSAHSLPPDSPASQQLSGNILHILHTTCHPTLQQHNSYNRTDNYRQWNADGSPDDGHKNAGNILR